MPQQKLDRKELRRPDEFQVQSRRAMEWVQAHQGKLLAAIGAVALLVLLAWGASAYKSSKEAAAGAALSEALEKQSRPIAGDSPPTPGTQTYPGKDERQKAVIADLEKVRTEHAGTVAAQTAGAELGFQKLKAGDAAGAQQALQEFLDKSGKDHPLRAFALESLGYAYEAQKNLGQARATFARLSEAGAPERADFQAARLSLEEGKPDARAQLEKVAKDYPKDPVSMEAQQRLELAAMPKAEPGQGTPAPEPKAAIPAPKAAPKAAKPAPGKATAKPATPGPKKTK